MIEIKLSQGAKPGHGGVLPASKITKEIADCRRVPMGEDCISPAAHSAFSTPIELMHFIAQLREVSGGKPVGFKLCVGHKWEFMATLKAMIETGIKPDFIVVDGKEGGTGAAPLEFTNHLGMPLADGLVFVRNALVGAGLRDDIRLGASGKLVSAFDLVWAQRSGRRLVQLRARLHVRRRLHSGTDMPHQSMPHRCHHAGSAPSACTRRRGQVRPRGEFPSQHAESPGRDRRRRGI